MTFKKQEYFLVIKLHQDNHEIVYAVLFSLFFSNIYCTMYINIIFSGKKLVEPTPDLEKELKSELEKVARQYGGAQGEDMTKFPTFKFKDPVLDPINFEK